MRGYPTTPCTLILLAACTAARAAGPVPAGDIARGEYLVAIMECAGCHTTGTLRGQRLQDHHLAGSEVGFGYDGPADKPGIGAVFPPNLTPDPETGLGKWTDEQLMRALRYGQRPDGRVLSPVMPWPVYGSRLTEADAASIVAYLRSLPAIRYRVPQNFQPGDTPTGPYMIIRGE
jgi:mono/diheme cytochrome c family protein